LISKFNSFFFPHDNKSNHFNALDGLRGLAVLIVLLSHSSNSGIFFHELLNFSGIGKIGVYLFFVLSAYLLDRQIALAFINNKSSSHYWKNYTLRRFLRIYPLFLIAIILYGVINLIGYSSVIDNLIDIPLHLFLVKGESIFWSIPVEFKYYIISPFIMWLCHKFLKWEKIKLAVFFLILISLSIIVELRYELQDVSTLKYLPVFLIGTMISIYEVTLNKPPPPINTILLNTTGLLSFLLILISSPFYFKIIFNFNVEFQSSEFFLPYAVLWGIILITAKYARGIIRMILEFKLLRFLGSISYSAYLFHMLVIAFVKKLEVIPQDLKIYFFFLLTIILSTVSYLIIELPLSRINLNQKNK